MSAHTNQYRQAEGHIEKESEKENDRTRYICVRRHQHKMSNSGTKCAREREREKNERTDNISTAPLRGFLDRIVPAILGGPGMVNCCCCSCCERNG